MNEFQFEFFTPLLNFTSNKKLITLSNDIHIRKPTSREIEIIKESSKKWSNVKESEYLLCLILKINEPEEEPGQFINKYAKEEIEKVLSFLRLFQEGIIGYNLIVHKLSNEINYPYTAVTYFTPAVYIKDAPASYRKIYSVSGDEAEKLEIFFKDYFFEESLKELNLAIDYFSKSYQERYTPRDSFLDLIISLENLFLKGITDELSFRLRLRMAFLLSDDFDGRKKIYDFMRAAYGKRSKLVHGESVNSIDYDSLFELRQMVRESIKIFIKNPKLRDDIDDFILKNGRL